MFVRISLGEKWPADYNRSDGMTPIIDGASLTFLAVLRGANESEIHAFRRGSLRYGLYAEESIPFILWEFRGYEMDCHINMHKEPPDKRDAFLAGEPEANAVQLYLVDGATDIVRGIRLVGTQPAFVQEIKQLCFDQLSAYASAAVVDAAAEKVLALNSIKDMLRRGRTWKL
jgi:hypothetical protein